MPQSQVREPLAYQGQSASWADGSKQAALRIGSQSQHPSVVRYPYPYESIGVDQPGSNLRFHAPERIYFHVDNGTAGSAYVNNNNNIVANQLHMGHIGPGIGISRGSGSPMIFDNSVNSYIGANNNIYFCPQYTWTGDAGVDINRNIFCGAGFHGFVGHYSGYGFGLWRSNEPYPFVYFDGQANTVLRSRGSTIIDSAPGTFYLRGVNNGNRFVMGTTSFWFGNHIGIGRWPTAGTALDVGPGTVQASVVRSESGNLHLTCASANGVYALAPNGFVVSKAWGGSGNASVEGNFSTGGHAHFGSTAYFAGLISKAGGGYLIDHPLDPVNKDFEHGFVEGPSYQVIYSLLLKLANGAMVIDLDVYYGWTSGTFEAVCRDTMVFVQNNESWTQCRAEMDGSVLSVEAEDPACEDTINVLIVGHRNDPFSRSVPHLDANDRMICEREKQPLDPEDYDRMISTIEQVTVDGIQEEEQLMIERTLTEVQGKQGFPRHPELYGLAPLTVQTQLIRHPVADVEQAEMDNLQEKADASAQWLGAWNSLIGSALYTKSTAMARHPEAMGIMQAQLQVAITFQTAMNPAIAQPEAIKAGQVSATFLGLLREVIEEAERQPDHALSEIDMAWIDQWAGDLGIDVKPLLSPLRGGE